jgi:GNAT superfamily N-acetyltransferase
MTHRATTSLPAASADEPRVPRPPAGTSVPLDFEGLGWREALGAELDEGVAGQLVELLRRGFNGGPAWFPYSDRHVDHLMWSVRDCPRKAWLELFERGNELVAFFWGRESGFLVRGVEHTVAEGGDLALDPSLQGKGFFSRMGDMHRKWEHRSGIQFGVATLDHPAIVHVSRQRGRTIFPANSIRIMFRPLDFGRLGSLAAYRGVKVGESNTNLALQARSRRLPRPLWLRSLVWRARLFRSSLFHRPPRTPRAEWTIRTVSRFDERVDEFFREAATAFDFIQIRDATYLNWRYCDPRSGPFVVRVAEEDGQILGYCVLLTFERRPAIVDLLALPGRTDVVRSLVADAIAEFRRRGAAAVLIHTVQRHPYNDVLRQTGFLDREGTAIASVSPAWLPRDELEFLADPGARVQLMLGDTDYV